MGTTTTTPTTPIVENEDEDDDDFTSLIIKKGNEMMDLATKYYTESIFTIGQTFGICVALVLVFCLLPIGYYIIPIVFTCNNCYMTKKNKSKKIDITGGSEDGLSISYHGKREKGMEGGYHGKIGEGMESTRNLNSSRRITNSSNRSLISS